MTNVVERTTAMAERGDISGAHRFLDAAAVAGDVEALATLASWYLSGIHVARDLPRARSYLRRAATIGHVDCALMEIAFTANGSGGPADWSKALGLLANAAVNDPIAAEQLALIGAMHLNDEGHPRHPPTGRVLSSSANVCQFDALFTAAECAHVAGVSATLLEPSMIVDPATRQARPDPVRTSSAAVIGPARENLVVRALNQRIAVASHTAIEHGEPLTVLHYRFGQQYRSHHDALPNATNQRRWTMLVYLNEGYRGGETQFADGLTVRGRGGDAILFRNLDAQGGIDLAARHAGLPVHSGDKWLCTRWIRERPHDPWSGGP